MPEASKTTRTITAHEYPLSKIFSDEYAFSIPGYQRPYSWGTEQAGELFDDLLAVMGTGSGVVDELDPYFLGSIVLIKGETADAEVIDGQQRLTTLTILLAAIRASTGADKSRHITPFICEKGNPFSGTKDRFRVRLRDRDQLFFQTHIQEDAGIGQIQGLKAVLSDSQTHIRENALLCLERLARLPETEKVRLGQFTLTRCYFVVVATPDLDSAFRIFSVLNDRGLDLTATDIIKARTIGAIAEGKREAYTAKWEETEDQLGRESFNDLFGHIRMIYRRAKPKGILTKEFEDHVTKGRTAETLIDEIIVPFAEAYQNIRTQSYESMEDAGAINRLYYWLAKVDNSDWLPPALLYLTKHRARPSDVLQFFNRLDRLAYGLMIVRADVNERIRRFSELTGWIQEGKDLYAAGSPLELTQDEQDKGVAALDGNLYEQIKIRLPVLLRLDSALSDGSASYEVPILTIEHVLPQNPAPDSDWVTLFPDEKQRKTWVHRLGNLALLSRQKNSQAQNFDFQRKKTEYFQRKKGTPFVLTSQVLNASAWTSETLNKRHGQLLDVLMKMWDLKRNPSPKQDVSTT